MNEKKGAVERPGVTTPLMFLGVMSVIIGAIGIFASFEQSRFSIFAASAPIMISGFVLIGFSAGLSMMTIIANYLAQLVERTGPPKPDSN